MTTQTNAGEALENKTANTTSSIVEDPTTDNQGGDDNKQEGDVNPYAEELERLRGESAKKDEIIEHKNRAIESMKRKKEEPAPAPASSDEEVVVINGVSYFKSQVEAIKTLAEDAVGNKLLKEIEQLKTIVSGGQVDTVLAGITSDAKERELIKHHYDNSIKHSGNIVEDLKRARLLANERIIYNEGLAKGREAKREEVLSSFESFGSSSPKRSSGLPEDKQGAADILDRMGLPEAKKYL